jgi:hypothetical protein
MNDPRAVAVEMARVRRFKSEPRIAERYAVTIPNIGFNERTNWARGLNTLVDYRRDEHQNLRQERNDVLEVAIEDRERREHHPDTQCGNERQQNEQREPDDRPARLGTVR